MMSAIAFVLFMPAVPARAGDKLLNVQGKLADNQSTPIAGSRVVTFRLYQNSNDPVASWVWEDNLSISFQNGLFNATLGQGATLDSLAFDKPYYLGMQVAGDSNELAPRQLLGASAYSLGSLGNFHVKSSLYVASAAYISGNANVEGNLSSN